MCRVRFIGGRGWARSVLGALTDSLLTNDRRRGGRASVAWLLLVVVLVSACAEPVEFTVPLAEPGTYEIDNRLVGTWYGLEYGCSSNPNEECSSSASAPTMLILLHIAALPGNKELRVRSSAQALNFTALQLPEDKAARAFGRFLQIEARAHPA